MGEPKGHYDTIGDVQEWVWDEAPEVKVPEGEFDPRDPKPAPKAKAEPKPKAKSEPKAK